MATPRQKTSVRDIEELDELLSEPTEAVIRTLAALDGDIVILGVGGKMGPTLARMAKRASDTAGVSRRVIGVSRFSSSELESQLQMWGAETLRYGVLVDIAQRVYAGQPVQLSMGYLNAVWQGDASAMSLQALGCASAPPFVINIAGPELLSVRRIAEHFGERLHKPVRFEGRESADSLLSNARKSYELFGHPRVDANQLIAWIADWVSRGGATLARPTHFEERAGRF